MNRVARYLVPFAVAAILGGCGMKDSLQNGDVEVDHFHAALNAGKWADVWNGADPQFRASMSKDRFGHMVAAIQRKDGKVLGSREIARDVVVGNGADTVTVTAQTTFERGGGTEQFVFRRHDRTLALAGYSIESRDVAMN